MAIEKETIAQFVRPNSVTHVILNEEVGNAKDPHLQDLLPFGFAIHHAGMSHEVTKLDRGQYVPKLSHCQCEAKTTNIFT